MHKTHNALDYSLPMWSQNLDALVAARQAVPFAWATQDCCMFGADAVLAMTGRDLAAAERGSYATAAQALRLLEDLGGLRAVAARAGMPIPPLAARRGDLGLAHVEERESLVVCLGAYWVGPGAAGLVTLPLDAAVAAWRVAHG